MLRLSGSKLDATASGVSGTALEGSPPAAAGVVPRLVHRPSRSNLRSGRRRVRLSHLLPALALGLAVLGPVQATGTEAPSKVTLSVLPASPLSYVVEESEGSVTVLATLDKPAPAGGVTVTLKAAPDPRGGGFLRKAATADDDYSLPAAFTIDEGSTSASAKVTIVDDRVDEGVSEYLYLTADAGGLAVNSMRLRILDDDVAGFGLDEGSFRFNQGRIRVHDTTTYKVSLHTPPSGIVTVTATSSDDAKVTVEPASVTFTPDNYARQTFTVTAVGEGNATISHAVTGTAREYSSLSVDPLAISVLPPNWNYRLETWTGQAPFVEGDRVIFLVTLNQTPPEDVSFNVSYDYSGGSATAADLVAPPSTFTMHSHQNVLVVPTAADDLVEGDEPFKVTITPTTPVWAGKSAVWTEKSAGSGTATATIVDADADDAKIAFGNSAAATAKYTASVDEDVSGGTLNVPVTVSHLPGKSTTFAVEVVQGGSATAYTDTANPGDYRIATASVTFGPDDASRTKNLAIAITDDDEVEENETIELRIAAADDPADDPGDLYARHESGSKATITIASEDAEAQPQRVSTDPLTASFERVPADHDGAESFWFNVRFSEALGEDGVAPVASSFNVARGTVKRVRQLKAKLWRVRITPSSWRRVKVTLAGGRGCAETGAVCAAGGRALSNTVSATVGGPVRIRVENGRVREGRDANLDFAVTLDRTAPSPVSVDYATADGTAVAGADYTHVEGTLTFAPGETAKTISVPILDDAIDEGNEKFYFRLSNPQGALLRNMHREATGTIRNDDPLQKMWLSRFGRTVASDAVAALTARFETPRDAGSHLTLRGQRLDLSQADDAKALAAAMSGLARTFGAPSAPAANDNPGSPAFAGAGSSGAGDPFARPGTSGLWNEPATTAGARRVTGRELLLGTSFRAVLPAGAGSQFTSWGQGASVSRFSGGTPGLSLSGETATGAMGMDYEHGRLLTGFAMMHSVGEGAAQDEGWRYAMGSTVTTMLPYARLALSERLSAWAMAGTGTGQLSLDLDSGVSQRYRTDLSMTLAATGVRGDLVAPEEPGGFALALKADAFWVRTESDRVSAPGVGNLAAARGEASRVRAVLDGSRSFALADGATLSPSVQLGLRQDGGDAETGTGMEVGAGVGYADPSRGLDMGLRVHGLAAHAEQGYEEWGVSGSLRLVPGGAGRGLTASLTPSWGMDPGGSERLWALPDASGLAANENAAMSSRLDAEAGYGMALFGDRFTGTPNLGLGLTDAAREYRMGWRLTSAMRGDPGFEIDLDATRREAANANEPPEHGVMLRSLIRW